MTYIYPNDLKAKPTLWLWALRDVAVTGICLVLSVLALVELRLVPPLICTVLYAFLSIRVEDASILDFLKSSSNTWNPGRSAARNPRWGRPWGPRCNPRCWFC